MAEYSHPAHSKGLIFRRSLTCPQTLQDRRRRKAIRNHAGRGLERTQGVAAPGAKPAIRFPDIVALLREELLQLIALGPAEHPLVPWPGLRKGLASAQTVAQMANRQRIGLRRIVFH